MSPADDQGCMALIALGGLILAGGILHLFVGVILSGVCGPNTCSDPRMCVANMFCIS